MLRIRKNRFYKIARIVAMFIVGLFVAIIIALSQIKLESLRSNLISVLQESTGLPVEIKGGISWKFSLRPKVKLNEVSIKNAEWAKNKNGFYAKKIDVTINLFSLFRDKPTIESMKVYNGRLFIEKNDKGQFSINFNKNQEVVETNDFPFDLDFGLESIELKDFNAEIENSSYYVSDLHIKHENKKDIQEYSGWLKSKAKLYPFIISFSKFDEQRKIYPLRIALSTGSDALVANVELEGNTKIPVNFLINGNIYGIGEFGEIFGLNLPDMPDVKVDIAGGMENKKLNLRKFDLLFKYSDLKISGNIDWSKEITNIGINLKSEKFDLVEIFPDVYESSGEEWIHPNRELNIFKDVQLLGDQLSKYNFKLDMNINEMNVYDKLNLKNLVINANLENSKLDFNLNANLADGNLRTSAIITADTEGKLDVTAAGLAERIYVGEVMNQVGEPNIISDLPVNFEFYIKGNGKNLSELMSSVTGPFSLYSVGPGYAHSSLVSYIYGTDFLTDLRHNIQTLFSSKKKDDQMTISCAAVNLKFRDGKVESQNGIAIETNAINMRLVGDADLGDEKLKASLLTVPVRGLKFSLTGNFVNSIEFKGNMAEPDVKINKAAVASKVASATGLGLLIAPFTGGISIVAGAGVGLVAGDLLENWLADDHPCKTAMEKGAPAKENDPGWVNKPMSSLVNEIIK